MAKLIRSKLFIGALCILVAAAVAFLILPRFYQSKAATESVVRVARDIPAGTLIPREMVMVSEVGSYGLSADVLREKSAAVGMVAGENLYAGEYLTGKRLLTEAEYSAAQELRTKGLDTGLNLVTIEFPSSSAGIAGVLRAGDTVDVYEYKTEKNEDGKETSFTIRCLKGLYVYEVYNRNMESLTELDAQKAALTEGENASFDLAPAYVVLRCTPSQILTLIRLERTKALHLALTKAVK